jgi:beta-phosphoglucomutase-like phosphatase (HAD superfamily)
MGLRYRCLLIDHDDTAVDSTASVHYPAHLEALRVLRPGRTPPTVEQWLLHNFHGIMGYLSGELGLTQAELARELEIWRSFTTNHVPHFFPGFRELIAEFRGRGGKVAVISHSEADVIAGHYARGGAAQGRPDLIFGWTEDPERRKPSPWPVKEALGAFRIPPHQALILDDLKPGVLMGRSSGVPVAGAGWSHRVPEIKQYMQANTVAYFEEIAELAGFLFTP